MYMYIARNNGESKRKENGNQMSTEFYRGVYAVEFPKVRDLLFWGVPTVGIMVFGSQLRSPLI